LAIRDIKNFNVALLAKWKGRLGVEDDGLWSWNQNMVHGGISMTLTYQRMPQGDGKTSIR